MMEVITVKEIRYAGQTHLPGDRFDATDRDAKILIAIGKVKPAPVPAKVQVGGADAQEYPKAESGDAEAEAAKKPKRGKYRRRDMRA